MADQTFDEGQERPRRQPQQYPQRSFASNNWRSKDDAARAEGQERPRRSEPYQSRNSAQYGSPRGQQQDVSGTRLYVGNLLYTAQKDDIASFFAENGFTITNVSMSIDPETGRNPSYCFVDFESVEDASRAMSELNGKDVMGRAVRINPGVAKRAGEGGAAPQTRTYNNRGFRGEGQQQDSYNQSPSYGNNRYNNRNENGAPFHTTVTTSNDASTGGSGKRLYIGNLPAMDQPSAEAAITDLFAPLNIEVSTISKLIAPHESKREMPGDHHYSFVELTRPEDVDSAIEALDGKNPGWGTESTLRVNRAREQSQRSGPRGGGFGGYQGRRNDGGGFRDWRRGGAQEGQGDGEMQ